MGIATRLKLARLIYLSPDQPDAVSDLASAAFAGGADAVVLVESLDAPIADATAAECIPEIREAARTTQGLTGYLGRPIRAAELAPDLLVLADDAADAARTRTRVGRWTMIGRRCNGTDEVDRALADPAVDFLLVGPGLPHIRHAAASAPADDPTSKPWFAVGGVTLETLDAVLRAGAMRVGVGAAITEASNPEEATRALKNRLRRAWNDDPRMEAVTAAAFGTSAGLTLQPDASPRHTDLHL
ncbi:MAG: thiamine phosphate synthase [Actinomycetes bacterium]